MATRPTIHALSTPATLSVLLLACAACSGSRVQPAEPAAPAPVEVTEWSVRGATVSLPSDWTVEHDRRGVRATASGPQKRCPATAVTLRILERQETPEDRVTTHGSECATRRHVRYLGDARLVCEEHATTLPAPEDGPCASIAASFVAAPDAAGSEQAAPNTIEPSVESDVAAEVFLESAWYASSIQVPVPRPKADEQAFLVQTGRHYAGTDVEVLWRADRSEPWRRVYEEQVLRLRATTQQDPPALLAEIDSGHTDPSERTQRCTLARWSDERRAYVPTGDSCDDVGPTVPLYPVPTGAPQRGVVDLSDRDKPTFRACDGEASVALQAPAELLDTLVALAERSETAASASLPVLLEGHVDGAALVASDWLVADVACDRPLGESRWAARGTEPFWSLSMAEGKATWTTPEDFADGRPATQALVGATVPADPSGQVLRWTGPGGDAWEARLEATVCDDGMGPGYYPYTIVLKAPSQEYRGCAYRTR